MIQKGSSQNETLPATCLCARTVQKQKNAVVVVHGFQEEEKKRPPERPSRPRYCGGGVMVVDKN